MNQLLYVIDAFTNRPFAGNPAAVCLLKEPADENWMQLVAREMNLSETAFVYPIEGGWHLRWFTPKVEVKLCGHATLATAFTMWQTGVLGADEAAHFHTLSGWLTCYQKDNWIVMDFPVKAVEPCAAPVGLKEALGTELLWVGHNEMDYLVEVADENILRGLQPEFSALATLPMRGVIVTCSSQTANYDFLSRFFAPAAGVNEDPVTGSAHCALGPYWQARLGKSDLTAYQASERGGFLKLTVRDERILLHGQAVLISKNELIAAPA